MLCKDRSIGVATRENGVDMEHSRLSVRYQEYPPGANLDAVVTLELSR